MRCGVVLLEDSAESFGKGEVIQIWHEILAESGDVSQRVDVSINKTQGPSALGGDTTPDH
jgi:hypothetical protein